MSFKLRMYRFWVGIWGTDSKQEKKIGNFSINEEGKIKELIVGLLSKPNVVVNISTDTKKHYIIHKELGVSILINGSTEIIKISNHDWKYAWKFRNSFINELTNLVVAKNDSIVMSWETEIFQNEIALLNKIKERIDRLDNVI